MLVDSHCHLDYLERDGALDDVLDRAAAAGVGLMVTICTKVGEFEHVLAIAERHAQVYCTVGVHPHEAAGETDVSVDTLVRLADHPKVVAIGETGLDYYYEHSPRAIQQRLFRRHVAAARRTGLPLVVHTRDADADTMEILGQEMGQGSYTGLIHCFTATQELAEKSVELGLYVSFSGILTFKTAEAIRATAAVLPMDRILVETDSPYLAPVPKRGKRCEPAFVAHTAARLAEIRGLTPDQMAAATTANFHRLFTKVAKPS